MSRKLFSNEEIAELKQNPHVTTVTPRSVNFTAEFKQILYESMVRGERLATVLEMYGVNTGILGEARIRGMSQRLYKFSEREEGFRKKKPQAKQTSEEESMAKRIKRLENELAYTKQEVEFLKKYARQIWRLRDNGNPSESRNKVCLNRSSSFESK